MCASEIPGRPWSSLSHSLTPPPPQNHHLPLTQPPQGNRDQKTLLPLTVAQVLKAAQNEPDDHFRVDGMELHQVGVRGCVRDCGREE